MVILTEGKKHIIIKRDGREEPYNEEKLRKVTSWAAGGKSAFTDKLLKDLNIKINNKIIIHVIKFSLFIFFIYLFSLSFFIFLLYLSSSE